MTERIERRLEELKAEFEAGKALLADLGSRRKRVRSSMLRISGAIHVLEELLSDRREPEISEAAAETPIECSS